MADTVTLTLEPRLVLGKKVRALRREGVVPVHIYGRDYQSQSLQCNVKLLLGVLVKAGTNTPIALDIGDGKEPQLALVREIQWGPIRGEILHVDFLHVDVTQEVTTRVPLVLRGESAGARLVSGTVVQQLRELEIRTLPLNIPAEIIVDATLLKEADDVVRVKNLTLPQGVTPLADPEETIARIEVIKEEVAAPTPEAVAAEGAAEGAAPAAAVEGAAGAQAKPGAKPGAAAQAKPGAAAKPGAGAQAKPGAKPGAKP